MISNGENYFYCDTCHGLIENPSNGMVSWLYRQSDGKEGGFRIHHNNRRCGYHESAIMRDGYLLKDLHITDFIDPDYSMAMLIGFIDHGEIAYPDREEGTFALYETRSFAEVFRRLTLDGYEKSRQKHSEARAEGFFDGMNEVTPYTQNMINQINNEL